ncbi:MAG: SH3 domain-containing protein [Turicibacter sp.]|nr:SH3 domain-containing protein [Turicibacter sp.]
MKRFYKAAMMGAALMALPLAAPLGAQAASPAAPLILDVSQYQDPSEMDYDKIAKQIDMVIVRVQSGTKMDRAYQTHIKEFQKRGIPVNVYEYFKASTVQEAIAEADLFYERTKQYDIPTYWIDVEAETSSNMNEIVTAFTSELREKVRDDVKIGAYISVDKYDTFNLSTGQFDGIWIPKYNWGNDKGTYDGIDPGIICDIHQYTEKGHLSGYDDYLDLSRLTNVHGLGVEYFANFGNSLNSPAPVTGTYGKTTSSVNLRKGPGTDTAVISTLPAGTIYQVVDAYENWINVKAGSQQGWINSAYAQSFEIPGTTTSAVNLRKDPGTGSAIITTLPKGASVKLIGEYSGWHYVRYGKELGWINTAYLK